MIDHADTTQVVEALEKAIVRNRLSPQNSKAGKALLAQLQTALRITFVGKCSTGKTSLINMMLGENSLPAIAHGHLVNLEYSPVEGTIFEYEDGSREEHPGICTQPERPKDVFQVTIQRPIESLRFQSYSEIRLSAQDFSTHALLDFIGQSSTITVWCSEHFDESEQKLWSMLPDHVKDHGFLALTMADRQIMKGLLESNLQRIDSFVTQEFFDVFPVAVLQALNARHDGSNTGRELWELSGGQHLFDAIHKQIALGRQEDTDRARLLLDGMSEPVEYAIDDNSAPVRVQSDNLDGTARPLDENSSLQHVLKSLTTAAENMLHEAGALGAFDCSQVLLTCLETVQGLAADLPQSSAETGDARQLAIDIQESENMLLLFKLEEDEEAALDAVSLLLQLKKEVTQRIPA